MEVVKVMEVLIDKLLEESMPIRKRKLSQAEARGLSDPPIAA